jgi:hypothetical protein
MMFQVGGSDFYLPAARFLYGAIGIQADGSVQNQPPVQVAVGRHIAAPSRKSETERRFTANYHCDENNGFISFGSFGAMRRIVAVFIVLRENRQPAD